jgi:hypothetical protein
VILLVFSGIFGPFFSPAIAGRSVTASAAAGKGCVPPGSGHIPGTALSSYTSSGHTKRKGLQLALEPLNGQGIAGYVPEP